MSVVSFVVVAGTVDTQRIEGRVFSYALLFTQLHYQTLRENNEMGSALVVLGWCGACGWGRVS